MVPGENQEEVGRSRKSETRNYKMKNSKDLDKSEDSIHLGHNRCGRRRRLDRRKQLLVLLNLGPYVD